MKKRLGPHVIYVYCRISIIFCCSLDEEDEGGLHQVLFGRSNLSPLNGVLFCQKLRAIQQVLARVVLAVTVTVCQC